MCEQACRYIATMKAIEVLRLGTPVAANVQFTHDRTTPTAGAGELLIRTEAAALNHLDLWVGRGLPGLNTLFPTVTGSDGAGIVHAIGAEVDSAWIGRRVLLNAALIRPEPTHPDRMASGEDIHMIGEHSAGTMAEFFVAPATNVLDIGASDPLHATAFGLTHLTAWRMLITRARLQPGQSVLITGIGGGVALAALGIAKHFGCQTIVTSRHASKLEKAKALGATHVVLDDGSDWSKSVRAASGKRGVDIVIDSIGKSVHPACIKSLARGGAFVTCGCTTGFDATTDLTRIFWNQLSILGSTMGSMQEFREVLALFLSGAIKPVIDTVIPAEHGAKAYQRLESGLQFGKVLVDWR